VFLAGATVSFYEEALPTTMNPLFAKSMVDFRAHELVFDRLFYRSAITNELKSNLVDTFQPLEGGAKLKVVLKKGIKWHDGKPLTAKDVCFTIDAMLNTKTASPIAKPYREAIRKEGACVVDNKENSATIAFKKIFHNPRERVGFSVVPAHIFDSTTVSPDLEFSSRPVGTGPMKGSKGRRAVTFTKVGNAHHDANIGSLSAQESVDPYVAIKTLINSGVQGVVSVSPALRPEVAASDDVALKSYDLRSWWYVAVNVNSENMPALRDRRVRQALNVALDRTELREFTVGVDPDAANPPCEFVSGPFVQSSPYYNRQIKIIEKSDRGKVKELMKSAGAVDNAGRWMMDGKSLNLRMGMHAPLDVEAKDLLNQVGNQLQQSGFDRNVYKVSHSEWNTKAVTGKLGDYHLLIGKWSFGLVEDVNAQFHSRDARGRGTKNIFNYSNTEVDKLLEQYDEAKTDTQARDAYHNLHQYLSEDLPYLFLWKLDTKSAWRNEVRNATITPYYYFTEFDNWKY
jgi:peptide/nickel transport system substrate-binding protein